MQLSGDGVSTSFGGYHASAGLGGSLDGGPAGGLFAEAGTPDGTGASAGLGGSVGSRGVHFSQAGFGDGTASESDSFSSSSAGAGNHVSRPNKRPAEFYDNIFNVSTPGLGQATRVITAESKLNFLSLSCINCTVFS